MRAQEVPLLLTAPFALLQVKFDNTDPTFKLGQLLALELHRFEDEASTGSFKPRLPLC